MLQNLNVHSTSHFAANNLLVPHFASGYPQITVNAETAAAEPRID